MTSIRIICYNICASLFSNNLDRRCKGLLEIKSLPSLVCQRIGSNMVGCAPLDYFSFLKNVLQQSRSRTLLIQGLSIHPFSISFLLIQEFFCCEVNECSVFSFLFYHYSRDPQGISRKVPAIKKLEHAMEDQIYHILRKNRIISKSRFVLQPPVFTSFVFLCI